MKLKNLFPQRNRKHLVRRFGQAMLVKLSTGEHELIGGTDADRLAAYEWTSLFAHEIVFTHYHRETEVVCRQPGTPLFPARFQPAT
jgi:hypothetical protein